MSDAPKGRNSKPFTVSKDMPLEILMEIAEDAKKAIASKKAEKIERLKSEWVEQAEQLGVTPEQVLGIEQKFKDGHRIQRYSPKDRPDLIYTKGPHPTWLKDLLDNFEKKTVNELVEIGEVVVEK